MSDVPDTPRNRGDHNAPHMSPITPAEDLRTIAINRVAWGAVFAGVVVALVIQLILNMIGIGVGAASIDPRMGADQNPSVEGFSMAAGIWWTVAGILAALAGGFVAGRLSGKPKDSTAGWHGVISWAATTLVVFYLLTSAFGGVVGGAYRTLAGAVGGVASAAGGTVEAATRATDPFTAIEQRVRGASGDDPAALREASVAAVRAALTGDRGQAGEARDRAAELLARSQNISAEEAKTQIEQYEQQYRQTVDNARRQAVDAAAVAAKAASRSALLASLALVLGALASWFGGRMGAVDPTITA